MTKLLTLKHWQLFLLMIVLPFGLQLLGIGVSFSTSNNIVFLAVLPSISILFLVIYFAWFYTLGTQLHKKLPENEHMNLKRFKLFLFFPVIYLLLIIIFVILTLSTDLLTDSIIGFFPIVIIVHLFSMFCIFYCLYFIAKAFKSVELGKPTTFSDFAGEFFLIWFFPIGIWIIQPMINKIFDETIENKSEDILINY